MNRFRSWLAAQPRALRFLLLVNGGAYLLWQVVFIHIGPVRDFVWDHLALNPDFPRILFEPWQLLTYAFLHLAPGMGGLLHVLFNMLWLVWIGRDLEELQGPARLFGLYVIGAIGGALLTVALHAAFPAASLFSGIVHGASGAVLAVMAGVALLFPDKQILLFLLGSVRLIHLVLGFLMLDILFLAAGGTSVSAHLGGALTGFAFARLQQRGVDVVAWAAPFFRSRPRGRAARSRYRAESPSVLDRLEGWLGGRRASGPAARTQEPRKEREASSAGSSGEVAEGYDTSEPAESDVDRILDKISESGYDSLTPAEKRTLYEASRR
jgi:membrane associated rhomboid family serine protease